MPKRRKTIWPRQLSSLRSNHLGTYTQVQVLWPSSQRSLQLSSSTRLKTTRCRLLLYSQRHTLLSHRLGTVVAQLVITGIKRCHTLHRLVSHWLQRTPIVFREVRSGLCLSFLPPNHLKSQVIYHASLLERLCSLNVTNRSGSTEQHWRLNTKPSQLIKIWYKNIYPKWRKLTKKLMKSWPNLLPRIVTGKLCIRTPSWCRATTGRIEESTTPSREFKIWRALFSFARSLVYPSLKLRSNHLPLSPKMHRSGKQTL